MDIIGFLTGKRDLTRDWRIDPSISLSFDFDHHTFCGVPLDSPIERLRGLGPSDNRRVPRGGYLYYFLARDLK